MDPISIIVAALAAGAAAGLKANAETVVKDAYEGIKALIKRKYSGVDLTPLENKPESEKKRESVAEDLEEAGAAEDLELLDQAKALADVVKQHAPATGPAIGVDLEQVSAQFLTIRKVVAEGTGVKVRKGKFTGGIDIGEVQAGDVGERKNP
jgi:hypothetical protein